MMKDVVKTKHGDIRLPAFMPDATYGSIRNISFDDARRVGVKEIVTTTLHIEQQIGSLYIKEFGGVHKFFGWDRPILTDSGGWQVFSLINSKKGNKDNQITEVGCSFIDPNTGKSSLLTPESSINIQLNLDSDIVTVLDDPIRPDASLSERKESIRLNTAWAKRSMSEFQKHFDMNQDSSKRPLIGCVVQGAEDFKLRKQSAEELAELDFDIYNFGGVPMKDKVTWLNEQKTGFYYDLLEYVAGLIPDDKIKYAMGVGQPDDIAFCIEKGWDIFDTVLPTRNARHGYLYVSAGQGDMTKSYKNFSYDVLHIKSSRYKNDDGPIDENLIINETKNISRAYLRHLIRLKEPAGMRIATLHNLYFYSKWMERLRTMNGVR